MECCRLRSSSVKKASTSLTEPCSAASPSAFRLASAGRPCSAARIAGSSALPRLLSAVIVKRRPQPSKARGGLTKPMVQRAYRPGTSYDDWKTQPLSWSSWSIRPSSASLGSANGLTSRSTVTPPFVT